MTKVNVLEWTAAAAKPLKTNDARQHILIQESSDDTFAGYYKIFPRH